ncbi:MAG TPA: D-alanyl-D-alanine carboxypeptidase [Acidobacteriota bacterium]
MTLFLPPASCLLPPASCFLPPASCLLLPASCLLPSAFCLFVILAVAFCCLPVYIPLRRLNLEGGDFLLFRIRTATILLIFFALWPSRATDSSPPAAPRQVPADIRPSQVVQAALQELSQRGLTLDNQGIFIESLDGRAIAASHNADVLFNPASVAKLATTCFALWTLGPKFQFRTRACYRGTWDSHQERILGDLIFQSDGDPLFRNGDARAFAARLRQAGLRNISGDLIIQGPFCLNGKYNVEESAERMGKILTAAGLRIGGATRVENSTHVLGLTQVKSPLGDGRFSGTHTGSPAEELPQTPAAGLRWIVEHRSAPLRDILWYQNAHSVNVIADRLGAALGGARATERFLQEQVGISPGDMYLTSNSGLDANGLTPRATVKLMRCLHQLLLQHRMTFLDVLPAAGLDSGTLSDRFIKPAYRGCVVAKTGTQNSWDDGVSVLAGILATRQGKFLFAIYNSHGDVRSYRKWQDVLLERFMEEMNGGIPWKLERKDAIDIYYSAQWLLQNDSRISLQSAE